MPRLRILRAALYALPLGLALVLVPLARQACAWTTLADLEAAGVQPMPKAEVLALLSGTPLRGETQAITHAIRAEQDGTVTATWCAKREAPCTKRIARGKGEWSVAEDGTLRLVIHWTSHADTHHTGKLYVQEGYAYLFNAAGGSGDWEYRFER